MDSSSAAAAVAANAMFGITPSNSRSRKKSSITLSTVISTVMDVVVFLSVSVGYILQDWYFRIWGYPKKSLNGELVLITGAGGGLGRLLAIRMTRLGAKTILWDISKDGLKETSNILQAMGGEYKEQIVDISKKEEVYKAAEHIRQTMGDVTLLINNAGVASGRALLDTPDEMIERSFSVNTISHFWTTKAFLPKMLQNNHGHIVTIASLAGHAGISKLVDYCASKFAAVGFDEALRLELEHIGADGVFTTCICPYFIQATGMFDDVSSKWVQTLNPEDVADRIVEAIRRNEKIAIVPSYLKFMLIMKWVFPWGCTSGFLRRIVLDAAPRNEFIQFIPPALRGLKSGGSGKNKKKNKSSLNNNNDFDIPNYNNKPKDMETELMMRPITTVDERNL